MPFSNYAGYVNILVEDEPRFRSKVVNLLDTISSTMLGRSLLTEINMCGKQLGIKRMQGSPFTSNCCTSTGPQRLVKLRQAFIGVGGANLATELTETLDRAEVVGLSRRNLAKLVAAAAAPTARTAGNLAVAAVASNQQQADTFNAIIRLAQGSTRNAPVLPGHREGVYRFEDKLIRALKPWLTPGDGANAQIYFDPSITSSCGNDGGLARRPPAIGLAHELCHAWRNVKGLRLFDDRRSCHLDDDEVMTTGFPPYQYERYTENAFRAVWPNPMDLRLNYR